MRKNLIILTLLIHLFSSMLPAQSNYPIYVSPNLMPPYTLKLSDYSAMGSQKLMVTIVVNDLDVTNLPVKLRVKMETTGVTIENPPTLSTIPIYLDGGSTTLLFGQDLIDNFNIDKLHFKGYSKKAYRSSGQLPEGFYRFTVEVLHFHTNKVISNQGIVSVWIAVGHPPQLQSPGNDSQLGQYIGMPITFSWLKSKVGSPIAASNIQYKLEMWEVRTPDVSPYTIAASMPVFHEFTTNSTFYSFDPASVMMEPGMTYAWRVTATDLGGLVLFEQDGESEIRTFTYKALCESVTELSASASGKKGSFIWTPGGNHTSYNVEVRNQTANWFSASESFNSKVEFYDLTPGQTYEIRVQSVCNSDPASTSDFTQWESLTIPVEKPMVNKEECPDCACEDELPHVTLKNFDLRQDLTPGDTLANKTGTTRFILHSVEPQGDGSYKGIFYFWAEIWSLKVPCEFWDLQVNTDNVIVNMDYESVYDPGLFLDVDTISDLADNLLDNAAIITSDASIKDTMVIQQQYESIYVNHEGELIGVSVDAEGNVIEEELGINAEETDKTLIQNQDGEEVVVTRNGDVMGVEEYKNTGGGNNRMIRNHNKEKEENSLVSSGMVDFSPSEAQRYGFDAYTDVKTNIQNHYPPLKNQYRPAFKSVASYKSDKVTVSNTDGLTFRDEMGLPAPVTNNQLTIRGSHNGNSRALYAYRKTNDEEEIAGKLNITSYDEQPKRVYIVPVNDADLPNKASLQSVLNSVYKQAITSWTVEEKTAIEVTFPSGTMTHGGSGLSTYNADQRAIVSKFTEVHGELEKEAYYLFFVKNVQDKGKAIAGYMPLQRQVGFIYGKPNNPTIAHELGHGAFNLRHPFSENNFIATEGSTHNLMDYDSPKGSELWKGQWDLIHDPENVLFAWTQGEEEGAAINLDLIISNAQEVGIEFNGSETITCITPAGKPYTLPSNIKSLDFTSDNENFPDGALLNFTTTDGKTFVSVFRPSNKKFLGYAELINSNTNDNKEKIRYKGDAKKIPDCRPDNTTKTLTEQSRLLLGKKIDCAINVYQIEYSDVANKKGVSEESYCGSGTYSSEPLAYDVEGKTPITVGDNTACLNKYAKEFYKGHLTVNSSYKETLLRIANLLNSIEGGSDAMFADYEKYCNKEGSRKYYGNPDLWGTPEDYELFEKALEAYFNKKETLEQLILAENDRDKLTDLAWLLVDKWSESISYDVRLHVIKKLSEGKMYGNDLFGNGQEYLAVRLIYGIKDVQEQAKFLAAITKDGLLETLFSRIGDEFGGDNFSTFIMLLSQMAKNNIETFGVQGDPMFIWVGDLFRSDKVKIDFTTGSQLKAQGFTKEFTWYPVYYGGGTSCTSKWNTTTPEYTLSPFTFIPVKFPKGEKFLESLSDDGSNIAFVPVIYLKALNAKRNTDVTKTTVGVAVDVASLCIGIGELNAAIKAIKISKDAIKILRLAAMATDVIITSNDIIVTLVEDDIKELEGGQEFLDKYRIYSALIGLTAFGADNLTKSPETLAGLSDSWRKFKGKYGSDPKKVINAVGGSERYNKIENIVDNTEDALRQTEHADLVSKTPDLDANYVEAIADIVNDWKKNALGQQIEELTDAPLGYQFYRRGGDKWIRRLDANNPKTPQLTVENGLIVVVNKYADKLTGIAKGTHQTLINGGVKYIDDGTTIKYLTKEGNEFAKIEGNALSIKIPHGNGWATQSNAETAITVYNSVKIDRKAYRLGTLNRSLAGEAQFWSPENPYSYEDIWKYADKYGIPHENLLGDEAFFEVGTIPENVPFITREAPGFDNNARGAIEVVVPEKSITLETFSTVKFEK